jgi:hypothetical protein
VSEEPISDRTWSLRPEEFAQPHSRAGQQIQRVPEHRPTAATVGPATPGRWSRPDRRRAGRATVRWAPNRLGAVGPPHDPFRRQQNTGHRAWQRARRGVMPCHEFGPRGQRSSTGRQDDHLARTRPRIKCSPAASSRSRRRRTIERHPRGPQRQGRRPLSSWGIHGRVQQASLPGCCQALPHRRGNSRQRPAGLPSYAHRSDPTSTVAYHGKRDPNHDQPVPPYRVRWRWWRGPGRAGRPGTGRRPATRRLAPTAMGVTGVGPVAGTGVGGDGEQRDQRPDLFGSDRAA